MMNSSARSALALLVAAALAAPAHSQSSSTQLPSFAEMEAAGARIGTVRVVPREIFDLSEPGEDNALFRWANRAHVETHPRVIERALLFKPGDRLSVRRLEEAERVLRGNRFIGDVQFRATAYHDGLVDIDVLTRDTWSLDPGISVGRSGGTTTGGIHLKEYNLLGTGTSLQLGRTRGVERTGTEIQLANDHAFGPWTGFAVDHASTSDGRRDAVAVARPFYALDARSAAGLVVSRDDRVDAIYNAGDVVSEYRHRQRRAEAFAGWSAGLAEGRVHRYSVGWQHIDNTYEREPGRVAPPRLPGDERLSGPFLRWQLVEDRFQREVNRNLIGRPEFYALGVQSTVQVGWASTAFGSTRDTLLYAGAVSGGWEPSPDETVLAAASIAGQGADGHVRRLRFNVQSQYYLRQGPRWLFYAGGGVDVLARPDIGDLLPLGGDNGLRGYPLRYQSGSRRALFTVEERFYTDLYIWRLFRIGGAAFADVGRAWGGWNENRFNRGWLGDVGAGLRIVSTRSAFSNVLHVDVAVPVHAARDVKRVQFQLRTRSSF